jgi:hypothetical protein
MENQVKATGFTRNILTYPEYCKTLTRGINLSLVHFPPCGGIRSVTLSAPAVHEKWPAGTICENDNEGAPAFNPYR